MEVKTFNCPSCGAMLRGDTSRNFMFCEYCGTKIILDDIEYRREEEKTERHKISEEQETERHRITEGQITEREWYELRKAEVEAKKNADENKLIVRLLLGGVILCFIIIGLMFIIP